MMDKYPFGVGGKRGVGKTTRRHHDGIMLDQKGGETIEGTVWLAMGARRQGALQVLSMRVSGVGGPGFSGSGRWVTHLL